MNGAGKRTHAFVLLALGALGVFLRVVRAGDWPAGPWIDELYFLRAARLAAGEGLSSLFGTTPMQPPDFLFTNSWRYYPTQLFLLPLAAADRLAGGGMASVRLIALGSGVLLFLASLALAKEATRERPLALPSAAVLLATSLWLLTQARWACDVVLTSAVVTAGAAAGLRAWRRSSLAWAITSGALFGLGAAGYPSARLALALPLAVFVVAWIAGHRLVRRLALVALLVEIVVLAPLALDYARRPERLTAHVRDLSILSRPAAEAERALVANVRDYAALFFVRGDVLPRHGDPDRPVVLAGVGALLVAGAAAGVARRGVERLFLLPIAVFLAGALFARDTESANANRVSLAAPFVLTLAALGAAALVEALPARDQRAGSAALLGLVLVTAFLDVSAFVRWASGPHVRNSFGVAERRLTEVIETERRRSPSEILVHPVRAARNVYFVDVLLGRPGDGGRHAVRIGTAGVETSWTRIPESDVLFAADASPEVRRTMASLAAALVARADPEDGGLPWALYRIPREAAALAAHRALEEPAPVSAPGGNFFAPEDGLYLFVTRGGMRVTFDGRMLFDGNAGGHVALRLAKGRHLLAAERRRASAGLLVVAPDGFALPMGDLDPP
ncbi:MAG TPA: hypothetical protein VLJ18_02905 [Thermoanaerobaculia bacterium]|nr:hypothetical protein [Thermoanaerobaculia bacterium]